MRDRPPQAAPKTARSVTKQSPEYGSGINTLELSEFELADATELRQRLLQMFRSPNYKAPVLPNIALELTELSRKPNVSYDDVTRVVELLATEEKDQMIAPGGLDGGEGAGVDRLGNVDTCDLGADTGRQGSNLNAHS